MAEHTTRVCWVVIGGDGAAAARSRDSITASGAGPEAVIVAPAAHPSPWELATPDADAVRLLHAGDMVLGTGESALRDALTGGAPAAVGGYRLRAPGRWGEPGAPPADLSAERLVLDCPVGLSCLIARPQALAGAETVPPDVPGGAAVLLAGLAARVGLAAVAEPVAVLRTPPAEHAGARAELAAGRTVLESRIGAGAATAGALRRRLLEVAFLDPAGPLDIAREPAALWGDLAGRADPVETASVLAELHDALFAVAERGRWARMDMEALPPAPPAESGPTGSDPEDELRILRARVARLNHLVTIADERDLWREEEMAALARELAAAREENGSR